MHTGTVISLQLDKGFGFIHERTGEPDLFFHRSELADDLTFNEQLKERRVTFDLVQNGDRFRAANIQAAK